MTYNDYFSNSAMKYLCSILCKYLTNSLCTILYLDSQVTKLRIPSYD